MDTSTNWINLFLFVSEIMAILTNLTAPFANTTDEEETVLQRNNESRRSFRPTLPRESAKHRGYEPKRDSKYNPSFGYEPYWPGGDWVFKTTTTNPNDTTSGNCGKTCNIIYVWYGTICGRNKFLNATTTFSNYCHMKSMDCNERQGWYIAHRGPCRKPIKLHPQFQIGGWWSTRRPYNVEEAKWFIGNFNQRFSVEPPVSELYNLTSNDTTTKK